MTTAFVFPGQGAQAVGMGRDLASAEAARQVFELADATLGLAISRLCFEGPEQDLTATENAQPALLTMSVAVLAALAGGLDRVPAFVAERAQALAGHSLGEYSALVAAGAIDFPSALRLVRRRGELMAQASGGAMAAIIGLDEGLLEQICQAASAAHGAVVIANYNSPGQLVISGTAEGVAQAMAEAKAQGAKRALPLKVSGAFHSPLMQDAADALAPDLRAAGFRDAAVPVISNVTAQPLTAAGDLAPELIAQITSPVRWIASAQQMAAGGVTRFVEIGAGSVLAGLLKRITPEATLISVGGAPSVEAFLAAQ